MGFESIQNKIYNMLKYNVIVFAIHISIHFISYIIHLNQKGFIFIAKAVNTYFCF